MILYNDPEIVLGLGIQVNIEKNNSIEIKNYQETTRGLGDLYEDISWGLIIAALIYAVLHDTCLAHYVMSL